MLFNNFFLSTAACALLTVFTGCAAVKYVPEAAAPKTQGLGLSGIYHRVAKGQTLWRISKIYAVELDEIIRINNIKDSTQIEVGQSIFIPGNLMARQSPVVTQPLWRFDDFVWPKKGKIISGFGEKTNNGINKGITIGLDAGSNIVASSSGTVVFSNENLGDYGKTLIISHNDGIMTLYSLLSRILVKPGDYINRGMPIAKCENGLLHFEIRKGHIPQNPRYYLPR
jgi:murein DD-endopeptidase MepM/ murein hydrolase activator NlpD